MWMGLTDRILARPWAALGLSLLVVGGLSAGLGRLTADTDVTKDLPQSLPAKQLYDRIGEMFPAKEVLVVAVEDPRLFSPEGARRLSALTRALEEVDGVQSVLGPTNAKIIRGVAAAKASDDASEEASEETSADAGTGTMDVRPAADPLPKTPEDVRRWRARLASMPGLVGSIVSRDWGAVAFIVFIKAGRREADVAGHVFAVAQDPAASQGYELLIAGRPAAMYWAKRIMGRDMGMLSSAALGIVLLILLLAFRSVRGVALPLTVVIGAVLATLGLSGWLGQPLTHSTESLPILLIAIGVADGIHILKGYYARARDAATPAQAVRATMADLNRPVVLTSLTTALGFLALNVSGVSSIMRLGLLTAFGVLVALGLSLVFIPATLALLPLPRSARRERPRGARFERLEDAGARYARWLVRRKGWVLVSIAAVVGLAIYGGTLVRSEMSNLDNFRPGHPLHASTHLINDRFGGAIGLTLVVEGGHPDAIKDPALLQAMDDLATYAAGLPHVGAVRSLTTFIKQMMKAVSDDDPKQFRIPKPQETFVDRWDEEVTAPDGTRRVVHHADPFQVDGRAVVAQLLEAYLVGGKPGDFATMVTTDFSASKIDLTLDSDRATVLDEVAGSLRRYIAAHFTPLPAAGARGDEAAPPAPVAGPEAKPAARVELTGMAELIRAVNAAVVRGQGWSIVTSLLLVWLVTALLFRSGILGLFATIPLFFSLFLNFGVMGFAGIPLNLITMTTSSIAIGVGVDYAIHYVHRVQYERQQGLSFEEAIPAAMRMSGVAIAMNALTVAAGFSALTLSAYRGVAHMGLLIAVTMLTSAFGALTLLPILFAWLKPRAFSRATPHTGAPAGPEEVSP